MSEERKKRGFAAISPERLREIASSGGVARKKAFDRSRPSAKASQSDGTVQRSNSSPA